MLNLSDKELDRLSREAAQEHAPGDPLGPRSWDKLQTRLDAEFGSTPNFFGKLRRLPFYYTPAILLILGVGYYFIRHGTNTARQGEPSGSPPVANMPKALPSQPDNRTIPLSSSQN